MKPVMFDLKFGNKEIAFVLKVVFDGNDETVAILYRPEESENRYSTNEQTRKFCHSAILK